MYHCDPDSQALGLTPGQFEGESIRFLSWTTARRFPAVTASAANLFNCTGLTVHVEDLSTGLRGEMSNDLGLGTSSDGPGIYDAYITKSSWTAEMADEGLVEPLNSHIVRTPGLAWGNVLQSAKKMTTFQQNGSSSVMMMPLDGDYWTILMRKVRVAIGSVLSTHHLLRAMRPCAQHPPCTCCTHPKVRASLFVVRQDLFTQHGMSTPETIEELVTAAEYFHGTDLNGDGTPDYGFCGKVHCWLERSASCTGSEARRARRLLRARALWCARRAASRPAAVACESLLLSRRASRAVVVSRRVL